MAKNTKETIYTSSSSSNTNNKKQKSVHIFTDSNNERILTQVGFDLTKMRARSRQKLNCRLLLQYKICYLSITFTAPDT